MEIELQMEIEMNHEMEVVSRDLKVLLPVIKKMTRRRRRNIQNMTWIRTRVSNNLSATSVELPINPNLQVLLKAVIFEANRQIIQIIFVNSKSLKKKC